MNLLESVNTLHTLLPKLKANDAKFAADLIASFKKYGSLTPKQAPWIARLIDRAQTPVFSAPLVLASAPQPQAPVNVGGFEGVVALFTTAKTYLKFPKITLVCEGKPIKLTLLGAKSKHAGAVNITDGGKYPYAVWYGRVSADGSFVAGHTLPGLVDLLKTFGQNPARVAKDHGKLTGNCCFCNKVLGLGKEQRSVAVGFGPDCAEHYGLKAEWLSGVAKAEAKASLLTVPQTASEAPSATNEEPVEVTPAPEASPVLEAPTAPEVEPTLTVSPEAQAVIEGLAASLVPTVAATCTFCDTVSEGTKSLHGFTVCQSCVKELLAQ